MSKSARPTRTIRSRAWLPVLASSIVIVLLIGCASPSTPAATQPDGKATPFAAPPKAATRVDLQLDWVVAGFHAPFFVALDKGWYREAGLDVQITPGQGSFDTVKVVGAGRAQFGFADAASFILGASQDIPATMIAVVVQENPMAIISLKEAKISKPKDMEGKSLGVAPGEAPAKVFPAFAKKNGIDISKVNIVEMSSAVKIPSLLTGKVDSLGGFVFGEGRRVAAEAKNNVDLMKFSGYGIQMYSNGLVVNNDFAAKNPALVEGFAQASMRALRFTLDNPDQAIEIMAKHAPDINRQTELTQLQSSMPLMENDSTRKNGLGWTEESIWKSTQDLMVQYGGQQKALELGKLYTTKYLKPTGK